MLVHPRRHMTLLLGLLLVAAGALALTVTPAAAHSELVSSAPADGASGAGRPTEVTLTFNENIASTGLQVVAMGPDGPVQLGAPAVAGPVVTAAWPADAPGAQYQVSYRVVSADGHPIDGSISFSYADAGRVAPAPASSAAATSSGAASAPVATSSPSDIDVAAQPASAATDEAESSGFPLWIPAVVVVVGVAIGAAIARAMRTRSPKS